MRSSIPVCVHVAVFATMFCHTAGVHGFRIFPPKHGEIVFGRHIRAELAVNVSLSEGNRDEIEQTTDSGDGDPLSWWLSLSRNNTIDCKCGQYSETTNHTEQWESEGVETLNEYPWSVSLVSPGSSLAYCGGTLINDRFVMTAASCVEGAKEYEVEVLIGSWPRAHFIENPFSDEDELPNISADITSLFRKRVRRVILNPKYTTNVLDFNIALLRLEGPVPTFGYEGGVSPVCLPKESASYDGMESSSLVWRFYQDDGFIVPEKRAELNSTVLSKEECKALAYSDQWQDMPDTMICSQMELTVNSKEHPYGEAWDCPGDAGGPLLVTVDGQKVQVGIDSWTACYGRPKGAGVYTRVQEFLDWIKLHTEHDGRHCAY